MTPLVPMIPKHERTEVILLAFLDQIARALIQRTKPRTSRHNRLVALRKAVDRVDQTYHGYLPDSVQEAAQTLLETLEQKIISLNNIPVTKEDMNETLCMHPK